MFGLFSCDADSGAVGWEDYWDKAEALKALEYYAGDDDYKWAEVRDVDGNVIKRVDNLPTED